MILTKELKLEIDNILKETESIGVSTIVGKIGDQKKAFRFCIVKGFIIEKSVKYQYNITEKGLDILDFGGIEKWTKNESEKENIDIEIKELTVKQLKGNIFQLKYWWLLLMISFLISLITSNFELILKLLGLIKSK
jgi:hypothetical protein